MLHFISGKWVWLGIFCVYINKEIPEEKDKNQNAPSFQLKYP